MLGAKADAIRTAGGFFRDAFLRMNIACLSTRLVTYAKDER